MMKQLLKGLSEEQIAKVKSCNSCEDLLRLAEEEGVQLTDEQLAAISGGGCSDDDDGIDDGRRKRDA
jgi:bacteriocin-like protein